MDEQNPIELESKNIVYDEPEDSAEGGEGAKKKKRMSPIKIILIVFCALIAATVGTLGAILVPELIIDNSEYSKTSKGLILYEADPSKIDENGSYTVDSSYLGMPVVAIREGAFEGLGMLREVIIPDSVTSIGDGAFAGCHNLEAVNLPASLREIGESAFLGCTSLSEILIPEGVEYLGSRTFYGCSSLRIIHLPSTLRGIGEGAFANCKALLQFTLKSGSEHFTVLDDNLYDAEGKKLIRYAPAQTATAFDLPTHTTRICAYAFDGCRTLVDVNLHGEVFMIEHDAFVNCSAFTIHIPGSANTERPWDNNWNSAECPISWGAQTPSTGESDFVFDTVSNIYGATLIEYKGRELHISVPETYEGLPVVEIGAKAFYQNTQLVKVTLPDTVMKIADEAFSGCTSLAAINTPSALTEIGERAFDSCLSLERIALESGIITLGAYAFAHCISLSEVELPVTLKKIPDGAFLGSGITNILLPDGITEIGAEAFKNCRRLKSIQLPGQLASLGSEALAYTTSLETIWLPFTNSAFACVDGSLYSKDRTTLIQYALANLGKAVTLPTATKTIGESAFAGADIPFSFTVPETVERIGERAFEGSALMRIEIASGTTHIGEYALRGCGALTQITVAQGNTKYTSIDGNLYAEGETLLVQYAIGKQDTAFTLPGSVTAIDAEALRGAIHLQEIFLTNVREIGEGAFRECGALTSLTLPISVRGIGVSAFEDCTGLRELIAESGCEYIGARAFSGCESLEMILLPASVSTIGQNAFLGCKNLTVYSAAQSAADGWHSGYNPENCPVFFGVDDSFIFPDENSKLLVFSYDASSMCATVVGYTGELAAIQIPNIINGYTVTAIGEGAFRDCTVLESIVLPSSITEIGEGAFSGCTNLAEIELGDSVTSIGKNAFLGCTALDAITLPTSLLSIGERAFSGCTALSGISIGASVSSLGKMAFFGCTALTSIYFDATLTNSFDCTAAIFSGAGKNTEGVRITIGKNARTVPDYLFSGYNDTQPYALNAIEIIFEEESTCKSIGAYAFAHCERITGITLPASIVNLSPRAFLGCTSLSEIKVDDESSVFSTLDGDVYTKDHTTLVLYAHGKQTPDFTVPNTVTAINTEAFYAHPYLESLVLSDSVTTIGDYAFDSCASLSSVTFGSSLRSIGAYAFLNCASLNAITIPDSVFEIGRRAFGGSAALIIYCQAQQQPEGWDADWNEHGYPVFFGVDESFVFPDESSAYLTYTFDDATMSATVTGYVGSFSKVTVPAYVNGYAVRTIASKAFLDCTHIVSITLPDTLTAINNIAFQGCYRLAEIINHSTLTLTKGASAVHGGIAAYAKRIHEQESEIIHIDGYLFLPVDGVNYLIYYEGEETSLALPTDVNGDFYVIADNAFRGMSTLTSVTLPAAVTEIGARAFYECTGLFVITASENLKSVGMNAFAYCTSLTDAILGQHLASIGNYAFAYCESLTGVNYGTSLLTIGESAFTDCARLCSITLPPSLTSIGINAFVKTGLTSVSLPNSITEISYGLFQNCTALETVSLGNGVTLIGGWAFKACISLREINLPASLREIGAMAFSDSGVVETEGGISYVYGWVIDCDSATTSIQWRDGVLGIATNAFSNCAGIRTLILPEGVHTLGENAFYGCNQLQSVTLPTTLETIGFYAFGYCSSLTSIYIPSSVSTIGELAFAHCNDLTIYAEAAEAGAGWHTGFNPQARPIVFGVDDSFVFPDESSTYLTYTFDDATMTATVKGYTGSHTHIKVPTKVNGYTVTAIGDTAFSNRKNLTGITLPDTVTSIGASAFVGCPNLVSITLPASLTSIGNYAFSGCESLVEVINLSTLTVVAGYDSLGEVALNAKEVHQGESKIVSLGDYLFYTYGGKNYLLSYAGYDTELVLPESYNGNSYELYRYAFAELTGITSAVVPDTVTAIGEGAFTNCYALTSVTLGNSIVSIGDTAFAACSELSSINFPRALQTIGENAFWACAITSVSLPNGVTELGDYAFSACRELTSVTLSTSLAKIGAYAFEGCAKLTAIGLPKSVTTIGARAFDGCSALSIYCEAESQPSAWSTSFNPQSRPVIWGCVLPDESSAYLTYTFDDETMCATVTGYTGDYAHVTIPSTVNGYTVVAIGYSALKNCTTVTSITLPDSITSIGNYAFSGCTGLSGITIPSSVTSIGAWAFSFCSGITSLTIPDSVSSIEYAAFDRCSALRSITLSNSLTAIGDYVFYSCKNLTDITIPASVTSIGEKAFSFCSSLVGITIPTSVRSIGASAFSSCTALTNITIPDSVSSIGERAFYTCNGLSSIILPDSVSEIGENAFDLCSTLTVYAEAQSQPVGWNSDWNSSGCPVVWGAILPDESSAQLTYTFDAEAKTATVTGFTGDFYQLTVPTVFEGHLVNAIGEGALRNCSALASITLPASLTSIGNNAFYGCYHLVEIINLSDLSITPGESTFGGVAQYAKEVHAGERKLQNVNNYLFYTFGGTHFLVGYIGTETDLVFPDNYNGESYTINDYAFQSKKELTSILLTGGVNAIGYSAFNQCNALTSVIIPDSVVTLGDWAFYSCRSLESVTVSNSVVRIGTQTFSGCEKLTSVSLGSSLDTVGDYAFFGCFALQSITLPDTVKQIGTSAFYFCRALESINLPRSLTSIGSYAFNECEKLATLDIPSSVSTVDEGAFNGCTVLSLYCEAKEQPSGWHENWNSSARPVVWGATLADESSAYLNYSFDDATMRAAADGYAGELTHITVPTHVNGYLVTEISPYFGSSSAAELLVSITLPATLETIGMNAFSDCRHLKSITLPESLVSIGEGAFKLCTTLVEVINLSSLSLTVGDSTHGSVALHAKTVHQGESRLSYIDDYIFLSHEDINYLIGYKGTSIELALPADYHGESYEIHPYAFYALDTVSTVILSDGVTAIGKYAFNSCSALKGVTLGNSLTTIGERAFTLCLQLRLITIPSSVSTIHADAFLACGSDLTAYCRMAQQPVGWDASFADSVKTVHWITDPTFVCPDASSAYITYTYDDTTMSATVTSVFREGLVLKHVTIPSESNGYAVTAIKDSFSLNMLTESITLPPSLISIGQRAFEGRALTSIVIPDSVTTIGEYAFYNCSSLSSVTLSQNLTAIANSTFGGCTALKTLTLGPQIATIGSNAFQGCTALLSINIPASVTYIGYYAFKNCPALSISGEADVEPQGFNLLWNPDSCPVQWGMSDFFVAPDESSAYLTYSLDDTAMTATVTGYTGTYPYVTIPSRYGEYAVVAIAASAFERNYSIVSVTIPGSVTTVGSGAFRDCMRLVEIVNRSHLDIQAGSTANGSIAYHALEVHTEPQSKLVYENDYIFFPCGTQSYLVGYTGTQSALTLPDSYRGGSYVLMPYAFYQNTTLTQIDLGKGVRAIGQNVFDGCTALTTVILPDALEVISYAAFSGTSLESIDLPKALTQIDSYAFYRCTALTSIEIPDTVMSVGSYAFDGCTSLISTEGGISYVDGWVISADKSLTSATVREGTVGIAGAVFTDLHPVTAVSLPSTLRAISAQAFSHCKTLLSIEIPDSVVYIGNDAFEYCSVLSSVTLSQNLTYIGDYAFECCALTEISLPSTVTYMGQKPFYGCSSLAYTTYDNAFYLGNESDPYLYLIQARGTTFTACTIHEQTRFIESDAFSGRASLGAITIPDSVTHIGNYAFSGCTSLAELHLGSSLLHIGMGAFLNCSQLSEVTIPATVYEIGRIAFNGCTALTIYCEIDSAPSGFDPEWSGSCTVVYHVIEADESSAYLTYAYDDTTMTATVTDYTGTHTAVTVPTYANGYLVTAIGDEAFRACSTVTAITLPSAVTSYGTRAFYGCSKLTELTVGAAVVEIGDYAFDACGALTQITVMPGNALYRSIDGNLYSANGRVLIKYAVGKADTAFTVPWGVSTIGMNAFKSSTLQSITIPDSVTEIGYGAFSSCASLQVLTLGNSVRVIGDYAFSNCKNLALSELPLSLESIGNSAFSGCTFNITSVTVPDSVTYIGTNAFNLCMYLESVTIGSGVTTIGTGAFADCDALKSITVDSRNTAYSAIDGSLYTKDGKTLLQYANGKADTAFTLPSSVNTIGDEAFAGSIHLTSITLPDSVSVIGSNAFRSCSNLHTITLGAGVTEIAENVLSISSLQSIVVDDANTTFSSIDGNLYSKDQKTLLQYAIGKTETYFVVPDTVSSIASQAFSGAVNLNSVTIPESVSYIGAYAFMSCPFLTISCEVSEKPVGWDENWNFTACPVVWADKLS